MKRLLLAAALLAAVLVPTASARPTGRVKLALVPLPKSALGPSAHSLALAHDSGVVSNADAANNAVVATAQLFRGLGRATGYTLDYGDAYSDKAGITAVETGVERYRTAAAAKRGLAFWKNDDALIKPLTEGSAVSVRSQPVRLRKVGSARFGLAVTISVPKHSPLTLADTQIADGLYVVEAQTASSSATAAKVLAAKLVQKIDRRLRQAVAGRLRTRPVKLPPPLKAGPPKGGPDLATLALTATDVGQATMGKKAYDVDKQALSEYDLEMAPAGSFKDLSQTIEWYPSANHASFLAAFRGALVTKTLELIIGGSGVTRTSTPVDVSSVGDEAQATILGFVPQTGMPIYLAVVVLTRGQATDLVIVSSTAPIQSSNVVSLAQAMARHLDGGVAG